MAKGYAPDEGGMQSYAQGVAEAYAAAGASVTVFGQSAAGPRRERVGPVLLLDVGSGKSARVPLQLFKAMRRQLRDTGVPLFVHGTTWRTSLLPLLLSLPYVTTFHGREFMGGGWPARRIMLRIAAKAEAIVAVSRYSAARLRERLGPACPTPLVLWNGTSVAGPDSAEPRSASFEAPVTILSLCRMEKRKNIAACVRACAELKQEGLAFRYLIGGRGPEYELIRSLVTEHRLHGTVEVLGRVDSERLTELYREADIFLHPQIAVDDDRDFEGFGITIADAMVHRAAVIAGQAGGPADIIENGVTGLLVNGEDHTASSARYV
jgi:glycosyltransferase involved in cell wall biosynthesis